MNNKTYAGIPEEFSKLEQAKIVLIPVPYKGAGTSVKGTKSGPEAFLKASENINLYDIETDTEVYQQGIYLAGAVIENATAEAMVNAVHQSTKKYIKRNKFVTLIGGDRSTSIGTIRAFNECFNSLTVLQIDAHANLLKSHQGSSLNNSCALHEASQTTNLIQVGVRSMNVMEKTIMDEDKTYFAHEMAIDDTWMDSAIDQMTDNVFLTFDLSALDVSIMTSVSNPEPGGLFWYETLEFLNKLMQEKNIVGFDIVGLCPNELNAASDFLTARLYYKMLSYKFADENVGDDYDNSYEGLNQKNNVSKFEEDEEY
ncbi:arginase family protein [Yeosuana sp.]|uniref:arginase family protein n=1 Tax=Yeosuana sp. TaxID=2529388 RepID=UPI0040551DBD|tara:strand:- start:4205 stop:5143 length:939 start_codon:yes stop_codon:yes gene_type:complete